MMPFCKLYRQILDGSLWDQDAEVCKVFITLLVLSADGDGNVRISLPGLAHTARVSRETCMRALGILASPDHDSTDVEFEGRRIVAISGGFQVLNYRKFFERRTPTQIAEAKKKRNQRAQKKHEGTSPDVPSCPPVSRIDEDREVEEEEDEDREGDREGECEREREPAADSQGNFSESSDRASAKFDPVGSAVGRAATAKYRKELWRRTKAAVMFVPGEEAAGRDGQEYEKWWEVVAKRTSEAGLLPVLEEAVAYAEACSDPVIRRAKALGQLSQPGAYVAKRLKEAGVKLPPAPKGQVIDFKNTDSPKRAVGATP